MSNKFTIFLCFAFVTIQSTFSFAQSDVQELTAGARRTTVHIKVEFISSKDSSNVCSNSNHGAGFIVSKDGHVLTANHLFKIPEECRFFTEHKVSGNIGGYGGQFPTPMRIAAEPNEFSDVVLLKFADKSDDYPTAPVCRSNDLDAGEKLYAFGFPHDSGFAPLDVRFSNPDGGGKDRWVVSSNFTYGMSGGPVYNASGNVVAFVQGGLENIPAVKYIVPLRQASTEIKVGGILPDCDASAEEKKAQRVFTNSDLLKIGYNLGYEFLRINKFSRFDCVSSGYGSWQVKNLLIIDSVYDILGIKSYMDRNLAEFERILKDKSYKYLTRELIENLSILQQRIFMLGWRLSELSIIQEANFHNYYYSMEELKFTHNKLDYTIINDMDKLYGKLNLDGEVIKMIPPASGDQAPTLIFKENPRLYFEIKLDPDLIESLKCAIVHYKYYSQIIYADLLNLKLRSSANYFLFLHVNNKREWLNSPNLNIPFTVKVFDESFFIKNINFIKDLSDQIDKFIVD